MSTINVTFASDTERVECRYGALGDVVLELLREFGESIIVHTEDDLEVYDKWRE